MKLSEIISLMRTLIDQMKKKMSYKKKKKMQKQTICRKKSITDIDYKDDIGLLAFTRVQIEYLRQNIEQVKKDICLYVNVDRTDFVWSKQNGVIHLYIKWPAGKTIRPFYITWKQYHLVNIHLRRASSVSTGNPTYSNVISLCPVGWSWNCRIHRLHHWKWVKPPTNFLDMTLNNLMVWF